MTREEAITYLNVIWNRYKAEYEIERETLDAYHMAIEALSDDTVSRETYHNLVTASNDIDRALREYQDKEENGELVSVVLCKDCKWRVRVKGKDIMLCAHQNGVCGDTPDNCYCAHGERREPSK